jgi:L-amino acid N-acyltransferase YncA
MFAIRPASTADAAACAAVYAPYVADTAISFEIDPPTAAEMAGRIERATAWLVLVDGGRVTGYAYAAPYATRPAYRWSVETSIYLEPGPRRTGAGRALYSALLDALAARGYRRAVAGLTLPNPASAGLHRALGFTEVGVFRQIGHKLGAWHDVARWQKTLVPEHVPLREPS